MLYEYGMATLLRSCSGARRHIVRSHSRMRTLIVTTASWLVSSPDPTLYKSVFVVVVAVVCLPWPISHRHGARADMGALAAHGCDWPVGLHAHAIQICHSRLQWPCYIPVAGESYDWAKAAI